MDKPPPSHLPSPPVAPLAQHPPFLCKHHIRDRLWRAAFGISLLLIVMGVGLHLVSPHDSPFRRLPGEDLIPSYMAGTFVRQGRIDLLMDFPAEVAFQAELRRREGLEQHGRTGPWLNPPFFAWVFVPLSALPYRTALATWFAFNLVCLASSMVMLCRMLPRTARDAGGWRTWGLVPLLMLCSMPLIQAMSSQQNTFLSLFLLTSTVSLWRRGRAIAAGLVCGLLMFKPQLGAVVAGVLICTLGRRAAAGVLTTGAALLGLTLLTMPGALGDYLLKLSDVMPWVQAGTAYPWERQVTFQGFWRLLLQGSVSGPAPWTLKVAWPLCAGGVAFFFVRRLLRSVRTTPPDAGQHSRWIAAGVAMMPLVMPYYMDYDLLLLAIPAVLFGSDVCQTSSPLQRADWLILAGWTGLFPWLFFNAAAGNLTGISLTVPLLASIALMLTARAEKRSLATFVAPPDAAVAAPLARAA